MPLISLTPRLSVPPNDAIGRVREPMPFGHSGDVTRLTTSIGGPLEAFVRIRCDILDDIHTSCTMISPCGFRRNRVMNIGHLESPSAVGQRSVDQPESNLRFDQHS